MTNPPRLTRAEVDDAIARHGYRHNFLAWQLATELLAAWKALDAIRQLPRTWPNYGPLQMAMRKIARAALPEDYDAHK